MEYKVIGNNDFEQDIIKTILSNRGIYSSEMGSVLNPSAAYEQSYSSLCNINKASELLLDHLKNGSNIFIQIDSDTDGITSSVILMKYIKKMFPKSKITYRMHEGKEHGIILDTVPDNTDLVIIPDAGSNQYEIHKELKERGCDVLVIDHHECEDESKYAIIVNNQLSPNYLNKSLTGAGMAYKVCQALDDKLGKNYAEELLDLVAIGNIADSADSRCLETRYYISKGLEGIKNPFLKKLFKKQEFSTNGVKTIQNTQFYINPLINAAIRVGSKKEKDQLIKSFLGSREKVLYKKRGSAVEESISIQDDTVRILTNLKNKQKRLVDKATDEIVQKIRQENLLENKILSVYIEGILEKNLTGLVANKLADTFKRPVLLARDAEKAEFLTGSIRGYDKGEVKNFKELLVGTGLFEFVEGHANAAGFCIKKNSFKEINSALNDLLKDIEHKTVLDVDFEIPFKLLKEDFILEIGNQRELWGYKLEEPLVAITDIHVNKSEIEILKKRTTTLKIRSNQVEFKKQFYKNEFPQLTDESESYVLACIGKCKLSSENKPYIEIVDLEVVHSFLF
ncbi:putative single-strand DNA-specific exonuclease; phage SPbeta [Bacillus pumilus]|uniref:DHH family phosphoesterase n=1 Tax=Bacillus pumilus TaxID=1408 RepID=UPI001C22F710|nr:DHH family phosphoesterase [Bacillus pumilus]MBU8573681.1 DHH family phosphoesterase [Bacillus pumilus]